MPFPRNSQNTAKSDCFSRSATDARSPARFIPSPFNTIVHLDDRTFSIPSTDVKLQCCLFSSWLPLCRSKEVLISIVHALGVHRYISRRPLLLPSFSRRGRGGRLKCEHLLKTWLVIAGMTIRSLPIGSITCVCRDILTPAATCPGVCPLSPWSYSMQR
ncbi:uncharacterized protein K489DRAFT_32055 [Dissoconium aciculare CBS 342.82]|uniref:Uncharacterized protein n=1 Tax=Dissoconium aciculare CBS 342.82 TaxID=1314786 RepID=A0A6J3MJ84_9PEZI|nr:uncharacterized protein K489DRAFT_32055 [Dissoconium aciculare CBS 342.82]KAF1827940.1 hypothetical protein K489DRAFT_32055 [Dissoconium aciculare CBS 342.82]